MEFIPDKRKDINFDNEGIMGIDVNDMNHILNYVIDHPYSDFYDDFYTSKNTLDTPIVKENEKEYIDKMKNMYNISNQKVQSDVQDNSPSYYYTYVNGGREDTIRYRIYLSPKPENLHNLAGHFAARTYKKGIGVEFKIQMVDRGKNEKCDRMVIYCSTKEILEQCLSILGNLKQDKPELFDGLEKAPIWYNSKINNVFIAPEILRKNASYGSEFERSITETIDILKFLYDSDDLKKYVEQLSDEEKEYFYNNFKVLLRSTLLKNSCCMKSDYTRIYKEAVPNYSLGRGKCLYSTYRIRK